MNNIKPSTRQKKEESRNQLLITDYKEYEEVKGKRIYKYEIVDLVSKYRISSARIYEILNKYGVKKRKY